LAAYLRALLVQRFLAREAAGDLATEVGLSSPELLKTWVRQYRREGIEALRPKLKGRPRETDRSPPDGNEELVRLQRENDLLRARNAYLKKLKALRDEGQR